MIILFAVLMFISVALTVVGSASSSTALMVVAAMLMRLLPLVFVGYIVFRVLKRKASKRADNEQPGASIAHSDGSAGDTPSSKPVSDTHSRHDPDDNDPFPGYPTYRQEPVKYTPKPEPTAAEPPKPEPAKPIARPAARSKKPLNADPVTVVPRNDKPAEPKRDAPPPAQSEEVPSAPEIPTVTPTPTPLAKPTYEPAPRTVRRPTTMAKHELAPRSTRTVKPSDATPGEPPEVKE